jgi:preprotein translocase subunit SecD
MINLGLDLAGGSHILLEADPSQVRQQRLEAMDESVRNKLKTTDATIRISDISNNNGSLTFLVDDVTKVDAVREAILPLTSGAGLTGQRDWNIQVVDGNRFVLTPTQEGIDQAVSQAMDTAVEVVRKRIDGWAPRSRRSCARVPAHRGAGARPARPAALKACWARPPSSNSSWWTTGAAV